ncbi:ATP-dependent peptidase [Mycena indigotica]|uniref:ATP-dependent peptidase n=1 Tax=Mycena indigotica TaxID=2126181 RepID=A0A8H6S8M3_9AGAR|nr:ATP-dependent peptidase [Mycena indigotica]KAF7294936.1 ATP-dependent peptidase [Mycena indigotica]
MTSLFLAACRARPPPPTLLFSRSLSSLQASRLRVSFRPPPPTSVSSSPTLRVLFSQSRHISIGSVFSRSKPTSAPSPHVVVEISKLEAEADINRHDVGKQITLFQALVSTNFKQSYEVVISRWEKMCEFDPTSPLLHSSEAFRLYLICLVNTAQPGSVFPAIRRRDALLAANPAPTTVTESNNASPSETSQPLPATLSESQIIGQSVLAGAGQAGANGSFSHRLSTALESRGGPVDPIPVVIQQNKSWGQSLVRYVLGLLVGSFFFLVILSVFFENTGLMKVGPTKAQYEPTEGNLVKFGDVHGVDEAKEELQDVVEFLKDPSAFASLGGKLTKGVLLTGPPGTGKTMLARAVAGEAGVPFFFASGSDFEEMFVGVGAKRVRELFAAARKKDRAIIFIDELDAVGGKRSSRDQQYMKQTLNQLLVEMDGFQQAEGIIVIAATNFPESLDQALVRPGRFDRIIAVPLPDIRGRAQILQHHMKGVITAKGKPFLHSMSTLKYSRGALRASLVPTCRIWSSKGFPVQAAIQAAKEHASEVALKHLEWAKDRILMGAEGKSRFIDPKNKLATAYHEGGHALVALYTEGAMPLHKVTCLPRGHALGYTSFLPEGDQTSVSLKEYLARIDVSMGGRVAEELIYGSEHVTSGASSDIMAATSTARRMVTNWGFSKLGPVYYDIRDGNLSSRIKDTIEEEVTSLILAGQSRATTILSSRIEELHRLAHALVEHETLDSDEVKRVIKGEPIRSITQVLEDDLSQSTAKD